MLADDIVVSEKAMDNVGKDAALGQWSSGHLISNQGGILKQCLLPFKEEARKVRLGGKAPSGAA